MTAVLVWATLERLLQSSRMHESKSSSLVSLSCRMNCNPRACMNQNRLDVLVRVILGLQSSRMHESKSQKFPFGSSRKPLQSSRMHESKYHILSALLGICRLQSSRMHELKYATPNPKCVQYPIAILAHAWIKTPTHWPPLCAFSMLQSSHMHESKQAECPRLRRLQLQSSRMHESKQKWSARKDKEKLLQSSRMHESKSLCLLWLVTRLRYNPRTCMN